MSLRAEEMVRQIIQEIADQGRGVGHSPSRSNSRRQVEITIPNLYLLPSQVVPGFTPLTVGAIAASPALAPLQVGTQLVFIPGYSAPAGSSAALPDATGRSGDTLHALVSPGSGGATATALMQILAPLSATGFGGSTAAAALTIV